MFFLSFFYSFVLETAYIFQGPHFAGHFAEGPREFRYDGL